MISVLSFILTRDVSWSYKMAAEVPVITTIFKTGRHEGKVATPVTSVSKAKATLLSGHQISSYIITGQKTVTCQPLTVSTWKAKVNI